MGQFRTQTLQTIRLAMPIVLGQLGIMLMGLADTIQVGQMPQLAAESLGAAGMGNSIFFSVGVVGLICFSVVSPMISKAAAEQDPEACGRLLKANLRVAWLLSVLTIAVVALVGWNYEWFGQSAINQTLTLPYLAVIALSTLPIFLFSAMRSFTDGLQKTHWGMGITYGALVLNIGLNQWLIYGGLGIPGMGLFGAGVATLISRIFMVLAMAWVVFGRAEFKAYLQLKTPHAPWVLEKTILKVGIPSGFQGFFEIVTFSMAVVMMGWISVTAQAAHMVAINMASLTYMAATGIASAGGINVGTALGERSRKEIFLAGNVALVLVMLFMSLCAGIMYFGRNHLVLAYTQSAAVIEIAVPLIVWGAIFQLFDGIQAVSLGLLRGLQDVRFPTIITITSYWGLGLPLCYYLGFTQNWGAEGIWIALTISLIFSAIFLSWRFYSRAASIDMESLKLED